jgi:uncharacterized Zn finger protein
MTNDEIKKRIDASPELQQLCDGLEAALYFHADNSVQFDPFLIIAIIGIMVNIFLHCREKNTEQLKADIRNIRSLPPGKLLRLRRQMNMFWGQYKAEHNVSSKTNPVLAAIYEVSELADDAQLDALLALAQQ